MPRRAKKPLDPDVLPEKGSVRVFKLVTAVQASSRGVSVKELARRFGVTERTIRRDVELLGEGEDPVGAYIEKGYAKLAADPIKNFAFRPEEVAVLVAALDFTRRRGPFGETAVEARDKLVASLKRNLREHVDRLNEVLLMSPGPTEAIGQPKVLWVLQEACLNLQKLSFVYRAGDKAPAQRTVRPYGLVNTVSGWYLIGLCETRDALRHFKVSRMSQVTVLAATFRRPPDFDLSAYKAGLWNIENGPELQVEIRFEKRVAHLAQELLWSETQTAQPQSDGRVLVRFTTRGTNEVARWIATFGGDVEVLRPVELREAVLEIGCAIARRYGNSGSEASR